MPQQYDQYYWAQRIHQLGIGNMHAPETLTTELLTSALNNALQSDVAARAQSIASAVRSDGANIAARHLIAADLPNSF